MRVSDGAKPSDVTSRHVANDCVARSIDLYVIMYVIKTYNVDKATWSFKKQTQNKQTNKIGYGQLRII